MPNIHCQVFKCLNYFDGVCNVAEGSYIDIDSSGNCVDMTEVTDDEYKLLTGHERS